MSRLSIIVPVYWNSDTLMLLYEDMREKILHKLEDYEIVFVDDGSGDNSWEIMNQIREMDGHVKLVKLSRNFGEHAAILAGLSNCTGDCAVTKQADLQEDSELILEMYEKWKEGNKVVLAVRSDRDEGPIQKFFANLYYTLMRKLVIKDMPKGGFDCYLLDRQVIQVLMMLDEKNSALTLQVLWVGFKSDKVYFHRKARIPLDALQKSEVGTGLYDELFLFPRPFYVRNGDYLCFYCCNMGDCSCGPASQWNRGCGRLDLHDGIDAFWLWSDYGDAGAFRRVHLEGPGCLPESTAVFGRRDERF